MGYQSAKALKAPIKAPDTPKPIKPRAITSDQTSFPKLNKIAPVAATKNKILWTFLAPNLSKRTPRGNWKRANVRKILNLDDLINKPYSKVTIELKTNYNINEIKDLLSAEGETKIDLVIKNKTKKAHFSLQMNRKFDLNHLKALKAKNYVEKITV